MGLTRMSGGRRADSPSRGQRDAGVTLVELLVVMTISVVLGGMILLTWFALSGSYANTVKRGEAGDQARFALARMVREIRDLEQPPASVSEVGLVRARPFYIVLYTTFNKAGNTSADVPPRLVMYRLYSNGELWRFADVDGNGSIGGVNITLEGNFPLSERASGEGGQVVTGNVVNCVTPSAASPTPVFTYIYYGADGTLATNVHDVRGTTNRSQVRAVGIDLLVDLNPGKSPVYTHLRSTAQLRNAR